MKKLTSIGFLAGCVLLGIAFGIGWGNWGKLENQETVMQILMASVLVVVVFLAVMAGTSKGRDRWLAMLLDSLLLLGFSALVFFSVGWMATPLALFMLVFSLLKLLHSKTSHATS